MDKETFTKIKKDHWNNFEYASKFSSEKGQIEDILEKIVIKKALDRTSYEKGLDIGIGDGRLLEIYSPHVKHITALDISLKQLETAEKAAKDLSIDLDARLCEDASKLEIEDSSYDIIICTRVLQHVYDWKEAIAGFGRILKPEGDLLLLTYNRFSVYGLKKLYQNKLINPMKGRFRSPISLIKELKKNGFRIDYYSGALMGQPELFNENPSDLSKKLIFKLERFCQKPIIKYFGGRQVVRAKKLGLNELRDL